MKANYTLYSQGKYITTIQAPHRLLVGDVLELGRLKYRVESCVFRNFLSDFALSVAAIEDKDENS